jgi:hypothetical protein
MVHTCAGNGFGNSNGRAGSDDVYRRKSEKVKTRNEVNLTTENYGRAQLSIRHARIPMGA